MAANMAASGYQRQRYDDGGHRAFKIPSRRSRGDDEDDEEDGLGCSCSAPFHQQTVLKRKSAVELLRETKPLYVKSEPVLDGNREVQTMLPQFYEATDCGSAIGRCIENVSVVVSTAAAAVTGGDTFCFANGGVVGRVTATSHLGLSSSAPGSCSGSSRVPFALPKTRLIQPPPGFRQCSSSSRLQNKLRKLLNADSEENVFENHGNSAVDAVTDADADVNADIGAAVHSVVTNSGGGGGADHLSCVEEKRSVASVSVTAAATATASSDLMFVSSNGSAHRDGDSVSDDSIVKGKNSLCRKSLPDLAHAAFRSTAVDVLHHSICSEGGANEKRTTRKDDVSSISYEFQRPFPRFDETKRTVTYLEKEKKLEKREKDEESTVHSVLRYERFNSLPASPAASSFSYITPPLLYCDTGELSSGSRNRVFVSRSKSDVCDSRNVNVSTNIVGNPILEADITSPFDSSELNTFFDNLGLDSDEYDCVMVKRSNASSPTYFENSNDSSSIESVGGCASGTEGSPRNRTTTNSSSSAESLSIVERNARIIKWLCNCRKALEPLRRFTPLPPQSH